MAELIYVLTVIYFINVVMQVEGDCIFAFFKNVLNIDLTGLNKRLGELKDNILGSIRLNNAKSA